MIEALFYQNGDGKERVALKEVRANYRDLCGSTSQAKGGAGAKVGESSGLPQTSMAGAE